MFVHACVVLCFVATLKWGNSSQKESILLPEPLSCHLSPSLQATGVRIRGGATDVPLGMAVALPHIHEHLAGCQPLHAQINVHTSKIDTSMTELGATD